MRENCTSGSVGEAMGDHRLYPTLQTRTLRATNDQSPPISAKQVSSPRNHGRYHFSSVTV